MVKEDDVEVEVVEEEKPKKRVGRKGKAAAPTIPDPAEVEEEAEEEPVIVEKPKVKRGRKAKKVEEPQIEKVSEDEEHVTSTENSISLDDVNEEIAPAVTSKTGRRGRPRGVKSKEETVLEKVDAVPTAPPPTAKTSKRVAKAEVEKRPG